MKISNLNRVVTLCNIYRFHLFSAFCKLIQSRSLAIQNRGQIHVVLFRRQDFNLKGSYIRYILDSFFVTYRHSLQALVGVVDVCMVIHFCIIEVGWDLSLGNFFQEAWVISTFHNDHGFELPFLSIKESFVSHNFTEGEPLGEWLAVLQPSCFLCTADL